MLRLILHLDMDAFFAEVEQPDSPALHDNSVHMRVISGFRSVVQQPSAN